MSISTFFHLESLEHTKQRIIDMERKLEELLRLDIEKAKAEFGAALEHLHGEVARIEALIPARVLGHVAEGVHPQMAVILDSKGIPTKAEQMAAEAPKN